MRWGCQVDELNNALENVQRWAMIGTIVVLFPVWIPIGLIAALLIAVGYCCDRCYEWMAKGGKP